MRKDLASFLLEKSLLKIIIFLFLLLLPASVKCDNTTTACFGKDTAGYPVAFGDFNSDERTDLFILNKNKTFVAVLFAREVEPLLKENGVQCQMPFKISSVVPGNFDGDSHLDVLITTTTDDKLTKAYILWGDGNKLNCSINFGPFDMLDQPLALDYNKDMIIDLFGTLKNGTSAFWIFNKNRTDPRIHLVDERKTEMRIPHSHSFLDLNNDFAADLVLSTKEGYDVWYSDGTGGFKYNQSIKNPPGKIIGQSVFVDLELEGAMTHLVPVCIDNDCKNSTIFALLKDDWVPINPNFKTIGLWGYSHDTNAFYTATITLRAGDFNMDGYPDLLATLTLNGNPQVFLLENEPCNSNNDCGGFSRTFSLARGALSTLSEGMVAGTFYDLYQDGVLDVILVNKNGDMRAFRNTLDYDANFVKVMVLTGEERSGSLPGPRISYQTTTQEGNLREAIVAQLPQSAHLPLGLPYSIFGLGRTPNFVDHLTVGNAGKSQDWTQIIPNSQMVVLIPADKGRWRAKLFVTPSKLILQSVAALAGTCILIVAIIGILYLRERKEDRLEKLQEAHRFHFDAM